MLLVSLQDASELVLHMPDGGSNADAWDRSREISSKISFPIPSYLWDSGKRSKFNSFAEQKYEKQVRMINDINKSLR